MLWKHNPCFVWFRNHQIVRSCSTQRISIHREQRVCGLQGQYACNCLLKLISCPSRISASRAPQAVGFLLASFRSMPFDFSVNTSQTRSWIGPSMDFFVLHSKHGPLEFPIEAVSLAQISGNCPASHPYPGTTCQNVRLRLRTFHSSHGLRTHRPRRLSTIPVQLFSLHSLVHEAYKKRRSLQPNKYNQKVGRKVEPEAKMETTTNTYII